MSTRGRRGVPQHVRIRIFERDGYTCQLQYVGCTIIATEVDDIINVASLGVTREQVTDGNRQAVCRHCHAIKTEAERMRAWRADQQRRRERKRPVQPHPGD